jgi:2-polyprenyl-6-methoxyphenol hydroxylase-like FAD-dependent oxidoreductase
MAHLERHAIVMGASMSGLLAARALADHYSSVTVIERDEFPTECKPRKGVPQARHVHGLLAKGREVLERLFPGLTDELIARGALAGDMLENLLWFNHGVYLNQTPAGLTGLLLSRPMLEDGVRRRLAQLQNVRLLEGSDVAEPVFDKTQRRVSGVRVRMLDHAQGAQTIEGDLVIDATGRGSRSPAWLRDWGCASAPEEQITVDLCYMTRHYRRKPEHLGGQRGVIMAACHPDWRGAAMLAQEGDRWIVGMGGYFGDEPPQDDAGYIEFARSLQKPDIYDVIKVAEPLSAPTPYHFKTNLRRYYEKLLSFPEGFLVFGDAICSFNPVYGQGMTVACLEALALAEVLSAGRQSLAQRFFQAAAHVIDIPWQIALGSDFQNPRVEGKRTAQTRFINWYIGKLYRAAEHDAMLAAAFLEVANLTNPPSALLRPVIIRRVWAGGTAHPSRPRAAQVTTSSA